MRRIELEVDTDESGTLLVRLPGPPGSYRVKVTLEWDENEATVADRRRRVFDDIRANGPDLARRLLAEHGEEAIRNPEGLLVVGSVPDSDVERPPQPALESREAQ